MAKDPHYLRLGKIDAPPTISAADKMDMIARARQRAERKIEEREHLRLELKAREYIQVCHECIDTLKAGVELPGTHHVPGAAVLEPGTPLDRGRIQSLKAAMDGSLRLLDRVLPPLKAVEVTNSPEKQADAAQMSTAELRSIVMRLNSIPGEAEEVEETEPAKLPWD